MARSINNLNILQQYLQGVLDRAGHHAQNVEGVSLALIGAVLSVSDINNIQAREYKGSLANIIWFEVNGERYALSYDHNAKKIELRKKSYKGNLVDTFDNSTTYQQIIDTFKNL